ncbi:DUF2938 domain-containing protein [Pannonibacter sp. SL95]|uniref:DUF2938 domain-containing protein n=1 Tax=Pannonibacter sp. SL95 TaxID=2995153 RepID=UPI00227637A1|nr:DUF2938 domain-containing protein [Pannonibacter sp. SL95]MCY1705923.1 DUF2938 domain-containing protein [Pannonibacter sp. SL95]
MTKYRDYVLYSLFVGIGATLVLDLWILFSGTFLGMRGASNAILGRWFAHLADGTFQHSTIMQAPEFANEVIIGWLGHYMVGILFAGLFLAVMGLDWVRRPTLLPALIFGISTIIAPFFLMQPSMGFGIASSLSPDPMGARIRNLCTHFAFGVGLYVSATVLCQILRRRFLGRSTARA